MPTSPRRALLLGAPALLLAGCQTDAGAPPATGGAAAPANPAARMPPGIAVTYVGAPDCVWCRNWHAAFYSSWQASPERRQVAWLERQVPTLNAIGRASAWPEDVRWINEEMRRRGTRIAAPAFALSEGDTLIAAGSGMNAWDRTIIPALRQRLAQA
jgi:hypothetical protein